MFISPFLPPTSAKVRSGDSTTLSLVRAPGHAHHFRYSEQPSNLHGAIVFD